MSLPSFIIITLIITLESFEISTGLKLPAAFKKCNPKRDDFNDCLKVAINDAIPLFVKDDHSAGFTDLEPLKIPEMVIGEGKGAVQVVQTYRDMKISGYSKYKVENVDFNLEKKVLILDGVFPSIVIKSKYSGNGKILILPIRGDGDCVLTLTNLHSNHTFTLKEIEKKTVKYFQVVESTINYRAEKIHFFLDNLFNGDKLLGDNMNQVLNDNWFDVFEDVRPSYEEAFAAVNKQTANTFFSKFPISEIFEQ